MMFIILERVLIYREIILLSLFYKLKIQNFSKHKLLLFSILIKLVEIIL